MIKKKLLFVFSFSICSINGDVCILTAFPAEYNLMKKAFSKIFFSDLNLNGVLISQGCVSGKKTLLAMIGIGMSNASRGTQLLIDKFHISQFLFFGLAAKVGSWQDRIGEIIVPDTWITYETQVWTSSPHKVVKFWRQLVKRPPFKCLCPENNQILTSKFIAPTFSIDNKNNVNWKIEFKVDKNLLKIASTLPAPYIKIGKSGGSATIFLQDSTFANYLTNIFPELRIIDMETTAAINIASVYKIPFIAFRMISDSPNLPFNIHKPKLKLQRLVKTAKEYIAKL